MRRFEEIRDKGFASLRSCECLDKTQIPSSVEVDTSWCLRFLRAIRDAAFATIGDDGLPSVRIIDVMATDGEGEYFDLGQKPVFRRSFKLGSGLTGRRGIFVIDESCTCCGTCLNDCPEGCISKGKPYLIEQKHCIRCGICKEVCPAGAVQKC